jgi:hypothetical protein
METSTQPSMFSPKTNKEDLVTLVLNKFVEAYDAEIARLSLDLKDTVSNYSVVTFSNVKLFGFFTTEHLLKITTNVFGDTTLRNFILSVDTRYRILIKDTAIELHDVIASGVSHDNHESFQADAVLMPERVRKSLILDKKSIKILLDSNPWLTVIILIVLTFDRTALFKDFQQYNNNPKSSK